jgi:hypothetical protein
LSEETVGTEADIISRLSAFQASEEAPNAEPVEAVAAPQTEQVAVEQPAATGEDTEQQSEQPEETVEAGTLVDIEFDGKVLKGSPEIREAVMRHADYTKKTMELAEHRALFQKEREVADAHAAFSKEIEPELQEIASLDSEIALYQKWDWKTASTDEVLRYKIQLDELNSRRSKVEKSIDAKRGEFQQQSEKSRRELAQTANKYLAKVIPNWGETAYKESTGAAGAAGFTTQEINNFADPRAMHLAWKAAQWDKLQAAKPVVAKKASEVPPVTKPGSQATTENSASKRYNELRAQLKKTGDPRIAQELMKFR